MYHVVHLFMFFFFACNEKGLLNFKSERTKLVYRVNSTRCSSGEDAFETSKTTIYRSHNFDSNIWSISTY